MFVDTCPSTSWAVPDCVCLLHSSRAGNACSAMHYLSINPSYAFSSDGHISKVTLLNLLCVVPSVHARGSAAFVHAYVPELVHVRRWAAMRRGAGRLTCVSRVGILSLL